MTRMHITFIGQNSPDKFSGGRYHAWLMAEATAYMGHEVVFVTDNKPLFYDDCATCPAHDEIEICIRPVLRPEGWNLPRHRCDILVVIPHGAPTPEFYKRAELFSQQTRASMVMVNFETGNWFNTFSPTKRDLSLWDGWKTCSESADMILSISREGTKYAQSFYDTCRKHAIFDSCYPAINSIVADSVIGVKKEPRIIVMTRFEKAEHKGGYILADLICEAMRGHTLVVLVGIGSPPTDLVEKLDEKARSFGVRIEYLHQISDNEKFKELKRSSLMLFPSFFEGFGIPPVEAQYCEVPCIAFDLPVLREVNGDGVIYVERGNVEMFRETIAQVLGNSQGHIGLKERIAPVARFESFATRVDQAFLRVYKPRWRRRIRAAS